MKDLGGTRITFVASFNWTPFIEQWTEAMKKMKLVFGVLDEFHEAHRVEVKRIRKQYRYKRKGRW